MIDSVIGRFENDHLIVNTELTQNTLTNKTLPKLEALPSQLFVDLSTVDKCDSIGVATLIWLQQQAHKHNSQIVWQNIPEAIEKILSLYKLNKKGLIQDARKSY